MSKTKGQRTSRQQAATARAEALISKHGPDYFRELGRKGGRNADAHLRAENIKARHGHNKYREMGIKSAKVRQDRGGGWPSGNGSAKHLEASRKGGKARARNIAAKKQAAKSGSSPSG